MYYIYAVVIVVDDMDDMVFLCVCVCVVLSLLLCASGNAAAAAATAAAAQGNTNTNTPHHSTASRGRSVPDLHIINGLLCKMVCVCVCVYSNR